MTLWRDLADLDLAGRLAERTDRIRNAAGEPMYPAATIRRMVAARADGGMARLIDALLPPAPHEVLAWVAQAVSKFPDLPTAYLRDGVVEGRLMRLLGPATPPPPWNPGAHLAGFGGLRIFLDPDTPPDVLELRFPDGRVERLAIPGPP